MSSQFPVATPHGTPFFREATCSKWSKSRLSKTNNIGNNKLLRLNCDVGDCTQIIEICYACNANVLTVHSFEYGKRVPRFLCPPIERFLLSRGGGREECLHLFQLI